MTTQLALPAMQIADDVAAIKTLWSACAVHGEDGAHGYAIPAIAALSLALVRSGSARYRLATLVDGSTALAVRHGRRGDYRVAFSARRMRARS